jgi:hypothetical protein
MTKYAIKWDPPKRPRKKRKNEYIHGDIAMISPIEMMQDLQLSMLKLWELNLNFLITMDLQEEIEKVPGVEILNILTPYKMQIAFGKLFDQNDVRRNIQTAIKKHISVLRKLENASVQQHS